MNAQTQPLIITDSLPALIERLDNAQVQFNKSKHQWRILNEGSRFKNMHANDMVNWSRQIEILECAIAHKRNQEESTLCL